MNPENIDFVRQYEDIQQRFYLEYLTNKSKYNEKVIYKIWSTYRKVILDNYIKIDNNKIELKTTNIEPIMCEMNIMSLLISMRVENKCVPYERILKKTYDTFKMKNSDYGNSFLDFGKIGLFVRLVDKLNRLITLEKKDIMVTTEQVSDTLLDIYNYTIILMFNY